MRRLPPFLELVAFEAVARHSSFTRAAAELGLTQSAVSHRIRRLEQHLNRKLVNRLNPGVTLTAAGAALLPDLMAALDGLARIGAPDERRLRVAAGSSLCTWWLAPRLAAFRALRPALSIELVPLDPGMPSIPEVDVRILWLTGADAAERKTNQAPLFNEQVFPVCSPKLLPHGRPLADVQGLSRLPWLHKTEHASGEWHWQTWIERLGLKPPPRRRDGTLRFADMGLILSAAVEGAGVALARSLLVHDALRDGRLAVPVSGIEPMVSVKHHVARWPSAKAEDREIKFFVEWLVAEARRSLAATAKMIGAARPMLVPQKKAG